jgi:hypothetical protein
MQMRRWGVPVLENKKTEFLMFLTCAILIMPPGISTLSDEGRRGLRREAPHTNIPFFGGGQMKTSILAAVLILLVPWSAGCMSSMSDILTARQSGEGETRVYGVNVETAWEISKTVFRWEKTENIEEHKLEGYMLTNAGQNFISAGSVMGAFFEAADSGSTKVTMISKRRMATNLATGLTEGTYHKRFQQAVDIVRSGKSLPLQPPNE